MQLRMVKYEISYTLFPLIKASFFGKFIEISVIFQIQFFQFHLGHKIFRNFSRYAGVNSASKRFPLRFLSCKDK
jgi:hypothetical protein